MLYNGAKETPQRHTCYLSFEFVSVLKVEINQVCTSWDSARYSSRMKSHSGWDLPTNTTSLPKLFRRSETTSRCHVTTQHSTSIQTRRRDRSHRQTNVLQKTLIFSNACSWRSKYVSSYFLHQSDLDKHHPTLLATSALLQTATRRHLKRWQEQIISHNVL